MDWFTILTRAFWCGCAALGFGVLFNTPLRSLIAIWIAGFIAGLIKFSGLSTELGLSVIVSSFLGSLFASTASFSLSKWRNVPLVIVAIPSIIPLVPGAFAYRAMMGLMKLTRHSVPDYSVVISDTVYNSMMVLFVILAITLGLTIPIFLFDMRKNKKPA